MEKSLLGDYKIIKQIGQGSLGTVCLAEHRFIKKQFAIKILPEEFSSDRTFIQRFEKEISVLASLDHPNLNKIHNISFAEGNYFLVSDCVVDNLGETTNLAQYLNHQPGLMREDDVHTILTQIASALDYAHQKLSDGLALAHRNLKLNNILIGKGDKKPFVLISDLGLARIIGEGSILTRMYKLLASALSVTVAQEKYVTENLETNRLSKLHLSFLQSYHFLAPEQKFFAKEPYYGPSADAYGFGVLAYYLLMRRFPEGYFPLPSSINLKKYNWDHVISVCLHPDPKKRPTQLQTLIEPIQRHVRLTKEETAHIFSKEPSQGSQEIQENSIPKPILKPQEIERPIYEQDPGSIFQMETTVAKYKPKPQEILEVEPIQTDMIVVESGEFFRGSSEGGRDEKPLHKIYLGSFAIDIHAVTNEQFVRFLEVMGGEKDSNNNDLIRLRESRIKRLGGKLTIESGYAKHPVVGVSWYGAVAYAKWIGKRLPTEAEWEVAARGGISDAIYPTGNNIERNQANFFSADTTAVMSYPPNAYGLYDMAGNVYEWCQDWYDFNYYETSNQEPENPKGPLQGVYRVLRGGCWKSLKEDMRCSHRHRNNPGTVNRTYGFRLVADVSQ